MQEKNKTAQKPPMKGDGTVHDQKARPDANWFGTSQEPQEEYIEGDNQKPAVDENHVQKPHGTDSSMSEGKPTL